MGSNLQSRTVIATLPPEAAQAPIPAPGEAPADVAHPKGIKSYVRRAGRTTSGQAKALEELGPRFVLDYAPALLDAAAAFGRSAPLVLEIGLGEATAHIARARPGDNFLCCEVHEPGVGALLKRIGEHGIENIRILQHDAVEVLDHMLAPASLAGVHIFFPDPWHKKRHNKRRLVQPPLVAKLAERLQPGGYIHYAPQPEYRPLTKFENRGMRLGHGVWDLVFARR
jgi:tRNA (guanine-N7-)-methyltransferase